jgi:hypothetical protein
MPFENPKSEESNIEKPPFLYHASWKKEIFKTLEPEKSKRDAGEGEVIAATPDLAYASMFLVNADDSWTVKGKFSGIYYMIIGDQKRFKTLDNGGYIYKLPSDNFECFPDKPMGKSEWISKKPAEPLEVKHYSSALEAMLENKVQIYFVDKKIFAGLRKIREDIEAAEKEKNQKKLASLNEQLTKFYKEILRNVKSENQRQAINVIDMMSLVEKEIK